MTDLMRISPKIERMVIYNYGLLKNIAKTSGNEPTTDTRI